MSSAKKQKTDGESPSPALDYSSFDQLDGSHPWQSQVPEGFISYPVRTLSEGRITYFNFGLAKEMGLIPKDHPLKLNAKLERKLLRTFNLRIINEYDQEKKIQFKPSAVKKKEYMATRYLQLQHSNKQGKTSGDGRCVWNGVVKNRGKVWDVSSRGTGVTALAPGAVEAGKPLKSGSTQFGYGCGLAEIDELYSSALLSEIFHNSGVNTERMLCIVDQGKNIGIGVRAGLNLFRPAHLFLFLKQGDLDALKRSTDFLIERQIQNKEWELPKTEAAKYKKFLDEVTKSFAQFSAILEREYIFAWLDWDGDNVLANAGIIDYGSIRQFGLRHDQYRFDDVERFSTNLNEQKNKARLTVQVFAQLVDYLTSQQKKPLNEFASHDTLKVFDDHFKICLLERFLYQAGFKEADSKKLIRLKGEIVQKLFESYEKLEKRKTYRKSTSVDDGINKPAIFNMRQLARQLPVSLRKYRNEKEPMVPVDELFEIMLAESATGQDRKITPSTKSHLTELFGHYSHLVDYLEKSGSPKTVSSVEKRVPFTSNETPVTGNALIFITDKLMSAIKKGLSPSETQAVIDDFIDKNSLPPNLRASTASSIDDPSPPTSNKVETVIEEMLEIVDGHKEDI